MKRSIFFTIIAFVFALGATVCGGMESDDALAESESAATYACTEQMITNESRTFNNYVNCTRANPNTQATSCASQKSAWDRAYAIAEGAGCF